jgi:hypothetical protein
MANPTTNYGFVLPTSSDLVTDLPADFDVALQGVDTRLKALQPGTTLGDLAYSSATANTNTRLAVGSTGNVLTVAGGVPTWAAPAAGGGMTLLSTSTLTTTSNTISITPTGYEQLLILVYNAAASTSGREITMAFNSPITSYNSSFVRNTAGSVSGSGGTGSTINPWNDTVPTSGAGVDGMYFSILIYRPAVSATNFYATINCKSGNGTTPTGSQVTQVAAVASTSTTVTEINLSLNTGNLSGTVYVYGVK